MTFMDEIDKVVNLKKRGKEPKKPKKEKVDKSVEEKKLDAREEVLTAKTDEAIDRVVFTTEIEVFQ